MPCSIPAQAKQQSGICRDQRCLGAALGRLFLCGWILVGTADFNGDGNPDYVLYKASTRQTAIWYMNNNVFVRRFGPTPAGRLELGSALTDR